MIFQDAQAPSKFVQYDVKNCDQNCHSYDEPVQTAKSTVSNFRTLVRKVCAPFSKRFEGRDYVLLGRMKLSVNCDAQGRES
jgi:hypothetical protein